MAAALTAGSLSTALPPDAFAAAAPTSAWPGTSLPATQVAIHDGGQQTGRQIMARDAIAPKVAAAPRPQMPAPDASRLRENPASKYLVAAPSAGTGDNSAHPRAAQTIGTQFLGAQASESGFVPPDSMGAVGTTQFVVMVNGRIKTFNKATGLADGVLNATTDSFWSGARNGLQTTDPRVRYDRLTGRWFFTMITIPTNTTPVTDRLMVAYSDSGILSGGTVFSFRFLDIASVHNVNGGCAIDYDTLAIDANALYVGGNIFCGSTFASLSFLEPDGFVLSKSQLLNGTPTVYAFKLGCYSNTCVNTIGTTCPSPGTGDDGVRAPQGVDNPDPAATTGYFAGVSSCFFGELVFARVSNPGGNPPGVALAVIAVPATMFPEAAPALNSTHPLATNDDRLLNAQLRRGHLWTTHSICVDSSGTAPPPASTCPAGNRDGIRWYDVDVATPALIQSGTVFDNAVSNPLFYYFPSINASGQGHIAMGFTESGSLVHAQAATVGRLASDASGTMGAVNVYQASTSDYNLEPSPASGEQRWGDYSYTSIDPTDDQTIWTVAEYANATDSWGVEAAQLKAPPPAAPSSITGAPFYASQISQTVGVVGMSVSGSGFFDSGPGFANRLTAAVSGGVTVNSIGYTDPTHISISINTTSAAAGTKDLTITDPDGQFVTVSNFITIQPPLPPQIAAVIGTGGTPYKQQDLGGFVSLGGALLAAPAVVSVPNGIPGAALYLGVGLNHDVYVRTAGLAWRPLDDQPVYCVDNPAATVSAGNLVVACEGSDHGLYQNQGPVTADTLPVFTGRWTALGGYIQTGPAAAVVPGRGIDIMVVGGSNQIYEYYAGSYHADQWYCLSHPALAADNAGNAFFACHGQDGALYWSQNAGASWSNASSLGGALLDGPAIAAGNQATTFYVEGTDHHLYHRTLATGYQDSGGFIQFGTGAAMLY